MRENGFLESAWEAIRLSEVLAGKSDPELLTASVTDRMTDVIARMKEHDISQMPVLYADGTAAGLVSEVDLLKHLLEAGHTHKPEETIESIVEPSIPVFTSNAFLEDVLPKFFEFPVVLITEEDRPVGILTKIDVLDFMAHRI
jgi:cystathionine beta-synthase